MTIYQKMWRQSRDRLRQATTALGFAEELADLMAKQLGSPKAIDRMASYVVQAKPDSEETMVDEMLAICEEIEAGAGRKPGRRPV